MNNYPLIVHPIYVIILDETDKVILLMPRYKLVLEYNGKGFSGWQRQDHVPSIQQVVETALHQLSDTRPTVIAAGRTDAGVHAYGQVIHVDLDRIIEPAKLQGAMNYHIRPHAIAVVDVDVVHNDFHARFDAVERTYLYRFVCQRAPAPLLNGLVWRIPYDLDVDKMQQAGAYLCGQHDFTTFRTSQCQARSPVRSINCIDFDRTDNEIHMTVRARSFLHSQIRSFAGTLERVGAGRWPVEKVKDVLEARDRKKCGPVAPPWGLYFSHVKY